MMPFPNPMLLAGPGAASAADPYWEYVKLLLYGSGVDGNQNFSDASSAAWPIYDIEGAVNNDADIDVAGTPCINFLQSNSNRLTFAANQGHYTTGNDFTLETFIRLDDVSPTAIKTIATNRPSGTGNTLGFIWWINNGVLTFLLYNTSFDQILNIQGATTLSRETTHHVCVQRLNDVTKLYLNGGVEASGTQSEAEATSSANVWKIGYDPFNSSRYLRGQLNWFRYTLGMCRYQFDGFDVPVTPFLIG